MSDPQVEAPAATGELTKAGGIPAASGVSTTDTPFCKNCGAPLAGTFCADCGQRGDVHVPTTHELIHEALEGITHSDSRLWVTLKYLLFYPGKLTNEFVAGRRVAYLPPIRLYLVLSVAFFLLVPIVDPGAKMMNADEPAAISDIDEDPPESSAPQTNAKPESAPGAVQAAPAKPAVAGQRILPASERCATTVQSNIGPRTEAFLRRACERVLADNGKTWVHNIAATFPKAMFIFLPLIAFFNMLMYWWPRQRYAVHLLFFVHVHAFAFLAFTLMWLLGLLDGAMPVIGGAMKVLQAALGLWVPFYIVKALRRVFKRGRLNTLVKATALSFMYVMVFAITFVGVAIYAAWRA